MGKKLVSKKNIYWKILVRKITCTLQKTGSEKNLLEKLLENVLVGKITCTGKCFVWENVYFLLH